MLRKPDLPTHNDFLLYFYALWDDKERHRMCRDTNAIRYVRLTDIFRLVTRIKQPRLPLGLRLSLDLNSLGLLFGGQVNDNNRQRTVRAARSIDGKVWVIR